MKEEKSFWEKLKRWIDGDEVLLDADEIISKKEKKEFIYEERIFPIGDIIVCFPFSLRWYLLQLCCM